MPAFEACALLFDLDGVLLDSTDAVERAWREWAAEQDLDGDSVLDRAHGRPTVETVADVAPHLDARAEADRIEGREIDRVADVYVHDGAQRLLDRLPAQRWAIVTSGTHRLAESRLAGLGLPVPRVFVTADDVTAGKPAPEYYLMAADRLHCTPQDCLVVEDTPAGIAAAQAAGIPVVAVTTTYGWQVVADADLVVPGVAALSVEQTADGTLRVQVTDTRPR